MKLLQQIKILSFLTLFLLTACMHPISQQTRKQITQQTTFDMVEKNPGAFLDHQLLLGGVIVSTENDGAETVLEIMRWQLNRLGEPTSLEDEGSRFLVKSKQLLDSTIFEPGVLVTLAGVVVGQEARRLDEHEYLYPVFELNEIHPWMSPFRYGIHRLPGPDYPFYVGKSNDSTRNPYDPGYSVYPYTQHWYRNSVAPTAIERYR